MTDAPNLRPAGPTNKPISDGSQTSFDFNITLPNNSANQDYTALETSRGQLRGQEQSSQVAASQALNDRADSAREAYQALGSSQTQATEAANQITIASNSSSNARILRAEAESFKRQAQLDPRQATRLKEEAKRKEEQATREEENARQALVAAEEAQEQAEQELKEAQDAFKRSGISGRQAEEFQRSIKDLNVEIAQVETNIQTARQGNSNGSNAARSILLTDSGRAQPPGFDPGPTPQPEIAPSQPPGIDGGNTPQPIISPSQPPGIDGGRTPQPVIKPSQPPGIDGGETPQPVITPGGPPGIDPDAPPSDDGSGPSRPGLGDSPYLLTGNARGSSPITLPVRGASGTSGGSSRTSSARGTSGAASAAYDGSGGGGFAGSGPGSGYLSAAKAILRAIGLLFKSVTDQNAIVQLAKNLSAKNLAQEGKTFTEAGMAAEVQGNSTVSQELRLVDAQLATMNADAESNTKYWEEVVKQNFIQGPAKTADLAKPA